MSEAAQSPTSSGSTTTEEVDFDAPGDWSRVEEAVDQSDFGDAESLIREATLQFVADILDEEPYECPREGCDETFSTERKRRGHLGSSEHALDVPDGAFWCGYCGWGPFSWRGLNAHHGSSPSHEGDPIRLDEEPDQEDLVDVDIPDHKNPKLLERLYKKHDGNISDLYRDYGFDVHQGTVRSWLVKYDIHDVTPHGTDGDGTPEYRDRERLERLYKKHKGNISEMHRQMDADIPYRTLHNWLKKFGIHDPMAGTGRSAPRPSTRREKSTEQTTSEPGSDTEEEEEDEEPESESVEEVEIADHVRLVLDVDHPDDVESFGDLATPDWLDEGSFYAAVDMAEDVDELGETLGWNEPDRLGVMVDLLDLDMKVSGGDRDE